MRRAAASSLAFAAPAALLEACSAAGTPNKPGEVRSFSFGYVEPNTTVDGFIGDTFNSWKPFHSARKASAPCAQAFELLN